jgi:signal transduction histidine kinase
VAASSAAHPDAGGAPESDALGGTVAILAPAGRDGTVAARVLGGAGIETVVCTEMETLCAEVDTGAGVVLLTEEALGGDAAKRLCTFLEGQPAWSDVPVVILTGERELSQAIPRALESVIERGNVTLLERPVRVATLVTVLRAALRARQRQYDVRAHLDDRKRFLASESSARLQAEEANRAKGEFLAMMSHELRTPLNAIAGYTQILRMGVRGAINDEQQVDLDRIERSQRHLLSLINDVLNFAKLEAGRVEFLIEEISMQEVFLSVDAMVMPQLRAKGIRYLDAGDCGDVKVMADEEKVRQILVNLLSNAIKFTPAGGEIRVECSADDSSVHTSVTDNGSGIPAARLESIFEPFVQVDRHLSSKHEGTGLGLSISRGLARQMGGDLTVSSGEGEGAVFTLTLPRAPRSKQR